MGFLKDLLLYNRICIQCHNNPDADTVASAYGLYRFFSGRGKDVRIIYGGSGIIKKTSMKMLIDECGIPITHVDSLPDCDLLLLADCQYGQGNVQRFQAPNVAVIDHHVRVIGEGGNYLVDNGYQSCSTMVYELLSEEGYDVKADARLAVAFIYGLYTDTSCFTELFEERDIAMRSALYNKQPLLEKLSKANMSLAELLVASDAMYNHYFDPERRFAIVEALSCEQTVLGIIGDFVIQVDAVLVSLSYTWSGAGYYISIRSCHDSLQANILAAFLCEGIGSGGGHVKKAGGFIVQERFTEKYGGKEIFDVLNMLMCRYMDEHYKK